MCPQTLTHSPYRREFEHSSFFLPLEFFRVLIFNCEFPICWAYYHNYAFGHLLLHFQSVSFSSLTILYMLNFSYFSAKLMIHIANLNFKLLIIFWMINSCIFNVSNFIIQRILFEFKYRFLATFLSHRIRNEMSFLTWMSFVNTWKKSGLFPFGGAQVWRFYIFLVHFIISWKLRSDWHKINIICLDYWIT